MALRVWSKLCCGQKWLLLLSPLFLLFLTISVLTMTLPLPLPPTDIDRRSSRALSSTGELRSRVMELPPAVAFQVPLPHIRTWKSGTQKGMSKHLVEPEPFGYTAVNDKNSIKERNHANLRRNKHRSKDITFKRKHHPHIPEFTGPKHRFKPSNHSAVVKHTAQTHIHVESSKSTANAPANSLISDRLATDKLTGRWKDRHTNRIADTQIHGSHTSAKLAEDHQALEPYRQHSGKSNKVINKQQTVKKLSRELKKKHLHVSPHLSEAKKNPESLGHRKALPKPEAAVKNDDSVWCRGFTEQDFPDSDHRKIRISPDLRPVPWLSEDDVQKMKLLAGGEVVSKARVRAHGQVLQVALDSPAHHQQPSQKRNPPQQGYGDRHPETHSERCQQGHCTLVKRTDDWFEVFAFHLDRVLGLNRSLPTVLRTFHSEILPYRYISGTPRPVVWWDPDIQHLADKDNDQNSVPLSWVQYQKLLQVHCGAGLRSAPCVGVNHSEWGRLALFDFLLQVNDRLDRYCCGFTPDSTELCVENLLHTKCGSNKDLLLVHILLAAGYQADDSRVTCRDDTTVICLITSDNETAYRGEVRKADPSRLVFIDNAGRPQQSNANLNFRLVEGIDEFPDRAVSVLMSGCLESLLLHSLYTDREFWDSQGGASGLRPLIHTVEHRGKLLLQHTKDKKLQLERDL